MELVYIAIFVVLGIALDWAFFERTHTIMKAFWPIREGYGYRETLFPRVYLTATSSIVVALASLMEPPDGALIVVGCAVFMFSNLYADYRVWRDGRAG